MNSLGMSVIRWNRMKEGGEEGGIEVWSGSEAL